MGKECRWCRHWRGYQSDISQSGICSMLRLDRELELFAGDAIYGGHPFTRYDFGCVHFDPAQTHFKANRDGYISANGNSQTFYVDIPFDDLEDLVYWLNVSVKSLSTVDK